MGVSYVSQCNTRPVIYTAFARGDPHAADTSRLHLAPHVLRAHAQSGIKCLLYFLEDTAWLPNSDGLGLLWLRRN